jgi:hypothetical protein
LDLGLKKPNIFQILSITRAEIRHSNFLAWLLDPNESHKLGGLFLKRFLREVFSSNRFEDIDQVAVEGLDLSSTKVLREWSNIDILINVDGIIICIENKVGSKEHSNQLERYKKIVENQFPEHKKTFVYLNPDGLDSETQTDYYHPIGYNFVVESLERILDIYDHSLNERVKNYISDYIITIKREIMGSDKLIKTAQNIYENHRELFDFVIEHKPQPVDRLIPILSQEIEKKGWILGSCSGKHLRFYTPEIKDLIYFNKIKKNGWKNRESFLMEFIVYPPNKKLVFKPVIAPSDDNYDVKKLDLMLREIEGFKEPKGKQWLVNYQQNIKFDFDQIPELTDDEIKTKVNLFIEKISPAVNKITNKFLENSEVLLKMKEN